MNVKIAAAKMFDGVMRSQLPDTHESYGKDHLLIMVHKIMQGKVTGDKAHRWLGWIQGCVCVRGGATLDEMKQINKSA